MPDTQPTAAELFARGKMLRVEGLYEPAIAALQETLAQDPQYAEAHMELGLAYCFSGLFDEAVAELQQAVTLSPDNAEMHLNLAKTYTMLGMYDEGLAEFGAVLELAPPGSTWYDEAHRQLSYFSTSC